MKKFTEEKPSKKIGKIDSSKFSNSIKNQTNKNDFEI
jgi:hypothetical protein